MKSTNGNDDMVRPQVGLPKHRRSACRAEMHPELSTLLPVADIDFGRSFGANMLLLEIGTNAEHRARSPLTLATMAGGDDIGIGGCFDTQRTATAMRGSRHGTPPLSRAARLQEGSFQSDRLLSIVLLAPVTLAQLPKSPRGGLRGTSGRCGGGLTKQVARNVEKGEASTPLRAGFGICLDENLDGLFAGVDLDTDGFVTKVDLVAASVLSSNDRIGH